MIQIKHRNEQSYFTIKIFNFIRLIFLKTNEESNIS